MEIFTNPNVAYLSLVIGFMLAMLALFAPGTGVLELTAIGLLVLAGYGISHLTINVWALILLLVGVFPFLIALRKSGRYIYLAISLLALMIGSAYLVKSDAWWRPGVNPVMAVVVSLMAGGVLWVVAHKGLEAMARRPMFNLDRVVGASGEAKTDIFNEGTVYAAGENWSAHSKTTIPAGTRVKVVAREGVVVEVEPFNKTV